MTPAGRIWCDRFPTSRSLDDLVEPFQTGAKLFIADLERSGCTVKVSATARPPERAWLMQKSWDIAKGLVQPGDVPSHPGIDIIWTLDGARAMVAAYGLAYRPSLTSRHIPAPGTTKARAVDMTITGWKGTPAELYKLGAGYGVHKLESDPPHWSDDGR